ncbi:proclotting enzyme-like [Amphibalanus amphitrite]|uniref:proclotting enzyme-like n=1 Tax=Amphibalanus amphitrite TaxID=1232801 RepID=UPI001C907988|nr:proclotting enzyme-like [Amphibalanus amphitrite]
MPANTSRRQSDGSHHSTLSSLLSACLLSLAAAASTTPTGSATSKTPPPPIDSLTRYTECDCGVPMYPVARIVNGQPSRAEEFPWMVALFRGRSFHRPPMCGGSLITDRHVVTAAHCLLAYSGLSPSNTYALVGAHNWTSRSDTHKPQVHRVWDGYPMATFDQGIKFDGDLAVLVLEQPVELNAFTYPICLPPANYTFDMLTQMPAVVIGYGRLWVDSREKVGPQPQLLFKTTRNLRLVSGADCSRDTIVREVFEDKMPLTDRQMCAFGEDTDSCTGDSGGPLMVFDRHMYRYYLVGVVSFGAVRCNSPGLPGFYTSVIHPSIRNYIACNIADGVTCRT